MPSSTKALALPTILSLLLAAPAAANQPAAPPPRALVLIVPPMLSADVSPAVISSLDRVFDRAILAAGASPADRDMVARKAEALGANIMDRDGAVKVAKAIGAIAVLRYRAKMNDAAINVRAMLYFTNTGKASVLGGETDLRQLEPTITKMMKELLPNAASSSPTDPPPPPGPPPAPPSVAPPAASILTSDNPNARSGLIARFHFGFTTPMGASSELLTLGPRVGGELGYQIQVGRIHAITPTLTVGLARWPVIDGTDAYGNKVDTSGGLNLFNIMAGVRYDLCLGPVVLWPAVRLGVALASATLSDAAGNVYADDTGAGFVMDFAFGAQYMVVPQFGAGIFFDVIKAFLPDIAQTEFGATGFSFGFQLTGKLPL